MRKDEMEKEIINSRIEREVRQRSEERIKAFIFMQCGAVWTIVTSVMGILGWLAERNSDRIGAAIKAFWEYSGK